ncbi:MAG: hypothetical protein HY584_04760 [Candidatus Omnitrophica bacterium]|nr:hypothetical protein [Candidatus Omnitrophota bacterium]
MKRGRIFLGWLLIGVLLFPSYGGSQAPALTLKVAVILASNEGSDFDLENDAYRDQLIRLFSYTAYEQVRGYSVVLEEGEQELIAIPGDYELILTLQRLEGEKVFLHALIQKGGNKFLDTELSLLGPTPVFLGGPPLDSGNLVLAIEKLY